MKEDHLTGTPSMRRRRASHLCSCSSPRCPCGLGQGSDEETLRNATTVLTAMVDSKDVPADVLAKADCVIVLPGVKKLAFGVEGNGRPRADDLPRRERLQRPLVGTRYVYHRRRQCWFSDRRLGHRFRPRDHVVGGGRQRTSRKTKVGRDMTAAAGPSGATSAGSVGGADILSYGRAKGLSAGMSLNCSSLEPNSDANQRLYGKASASDIVRANEVKATPGGEPLFCC